MQIEKQPYSTASVKRPNSYWAFNAEDYDESIPKVYPPIPKSHQNHLFVSYNAGFISFKQFKRRGQKISLIEQKKFKMPEFTGNGQEFRGINVVEYLDNDKTKVMCCSLGQQFEYDLGNASSNPGKVEKNRYGMICNFKKYKNFNIFFRNDDIVVFENKDRRMMSYVSTKGFSGDYSGGFHAYSRGAEIKDDLLFYIDT